LRAGMYYNFFGCVIKTASPLVCVLLYEC